MFLPVFKDIWMLTSLWSFFTPAVIARVALIDTRLKSYRQACIGTVPTALNAGRVFITLFPNFNVSLQDPNLLNTLKVQLQLVRAPMQEKSVAATLHHQIVYQIQDHAHLILYYPHRMKHYISKSHMHPKHQTQYKSLDKYLVRNYCADCRSHG